ncbi:DUF4244 domain-containing protein [Microlunatus ginsengisoli]|uniref:DUF4244 domain-containing protein n=1 Tax=Microlunatus ginsengisoli TaxID=363863 RepID=A0ABP7AQ91_9ACTN
MINNLDCSGAEVVDITDRFQLDAGPFDLDAGHLDPGDLDLGVVPSPVGATGLARRLGDRGMVTAEWAVGVVVAVSLAGLLLLFVVKGPAKDLITGIILKIINAVSAWGLKG